MNPTHPLVRRIFAGVCISLFSIVALAAFVVPTGAFDGRATSLRIDGPAEVTTTTTPAAAAEPAPEPEIATTTTSSPPAATAPAPTTVTTEIAQPAVTAKAQSGHFICPGGMNSTTQFDGPDCVADNTIDPGPVNASPNADPNLPAAADGDQPGQTLGSTDPAYGADLTAKSCAIKPWLCGDGWTR